MKFKTNLILQFIILCFFVAQSSAQITREFEIKVSDSGLYFDGKARKSDFHINEPGFEYFFGRRITPHGDCIKKYGDFLFLTWYLGGEENKNVMLSRLHIPTQTLETIEFPHTHVGYQHKYPHIGDSHNTIAVAVCPLDSTVHLLYDMHSYSKNEFPETFFNYQVSLQGAANAPVGEFTIDLFNPRQNYLNPAYNYSDITYPNFFLNNNDELFVWFREGGNNNGKYKFAKYNEGTWGPFTNFSTLNAKSQGSAYNWGLYGDMKYINGKLRVGFLKRMSYNNDKYVYNNGFHYAYTDDSEGKTEWYNYKGESFSLPLIKPEKIFFYEPGDEVTQGGANSVYISSGTDFTVTDEEAVHFITNNVKSTVDGTKKDVHAYKKEDDTEFTISTDFPGGSLYSVDGNQVFLISTNNNRPEIYRALGGTNDWEKLYTETTGISMEHKNVLIADGKLFVYAMQKANGDARPIYIQMYDLDIAPIDTSRYLDFINLTNGQEIEKGTNLTIEASVGSAFTEVTLWSDTVNLGTLTSAPYIWTGHDVLTNMEEPQYSFKLLAKDTAGVEVVKTITISLISEGVPVVNAQAMIDKLLLYYPLEEDGTDFSGNENHGTPGTAVSFAAGKNGNAAAFSYTEGSYLTTADSVFKYSHPTAYTIAFWLKVSDYSSRGDILQPAGGRTLLYSNGDQSFRTFHQKNVATFNVENDEKDDWFHVSMVIDQRDGQTQHKFYINGEQRGSVASGYSLETDKPQAIGRLIFGSSSDAALQRNFTGMLDEIYMFDEVLTEEEIQFLMNTDNLMALSDDNRVSLNMNFNDVTRISNWQLDSETDNVNISIVETPTPFRTGSKAIKLDGFNRNTGFHVSNVIDDYVVAKPGDYVHSIIHAVASESGGLVAPSFKSDWASVTPGFRDLSIDEMSRFTFRRQYPDTETDNMRIYPRLRTKPGATSNEVYFDDLVLYTHTSSEVDLVAPEQASDFVFNSQTAVLNTISWTEGTDTLTGVQKTYVLRTRTRSSGEEAVSPEVPELMPQVAYSVEGGMYGPNEIGDWTIIAELAAGDTTFTDNTASGGTAYTYAIIHRDLAYNYSGALLGIDYPTAIHEKPETSYICYGSKGKIQFDNLKNQANIAIYSINGSKIFEGYANSSSLSVPVSIQGIYIVNVSGEVKKVIVR